MHGGILQGMLSIYKHTHAIMQWQCIRAEVTMEIPNHEICQHSIALYNIFFTYIALYCQSEVTAGSETITCYYTPVKMTVTWVQIVSKINLPTTPEHSCSKPKWKSHIAVGGFSVAFLPSTLCFLHQLLVTNGDLPEPSYLCTAVQVLSKKLLVVGWGDDHAGQVYHTQSVEIMGKCKPWFQREKRYPYIFLHYGCKLMWKRCRDEAL